MAARRSRRFLAALLVPVLVLLVDTGTGGAQEPPALTPIGLTATDRVQAQKAPTSRLAETDPALLGRTDTTPVDVVVKLDYDATATYAGGVRGLEATSPSVTGRPLTGESPAEQAYEGYATQQEADFVAELGQRVPEAATGGVLRTVYGGMAATVPANRVADVLAIGNVVAVQQNALRQPLTDSSPAFLGAPTIYSGLGTTANAGQGVIYGNLDTGLWPEHPSFADLGNLAAPPGPARECDFGDNPLTPANDPFVCNNKLIGGAAFLDTYLSDPARAAAEPFHTARDSNGHGTHTSSTSAGNIVEDVSILGSELAPIHGMAPGAWVMEYKVCGIEGCFNLDSAAAVGQAILDGVDVINFSISGGSQPFTDPVELAFLDAYAAGVFVSASAGNSGPGAGTTDHLGPWTTTVAASTQTREFATTLTLTAGNGDTFTADGASLMPGVGPLPVVMADSLAGYDQRCLTPAPAGSFTGTIVACRRGTIGRVEKGFNVLQGGAAGMILFNPTLADVETDTHWLPAVHLADGTAFVAFMGSHTGVTGSFPAGVARDGQGDVMAAFSSRGPGGNVIKPDVTAPGVQILAGDTPISEAPVNGPPGEFFQAIAGTSMSSPHTAGAGILLKALNPDWTPGQVRSALMTTATTDVLKEDLATPADPFDFGAGRIDLHHAGGPGLTFDETAERMALLGNDPINAIHLNIPSINAPVMPGRVTTIRTAKNVSGVRQSYSTEATAPAGSTIEVLPKSFSLGSGQSIQLTITIRSTAPTAQYFGEVRVVPRRGNIPTLHLPVAFVPQQGDVSLSSECSPTQIPVNGVSTCEITAQNNSFSDTTVDLVTTVNQKLRVVGADGATITGPRRVEKSNVPLAGIVPGVPSVGPGELFGYFPLDDFTEPIAIGDEEIINFTMSPFEYHGQTYDRVGVDSNGYLIVGGGVAEDNNCCNLPPGPDPARPNNILAPFWTDLDGTNDEGILATGLTDGTNTWVVFEWRVDVFGTDSNRTFQVWIGVDGVEDITFAYPAPPANPGQAFLVGAENQLGQGDVEAVLPTTDLRVTSTASTPGDSVSYTVDVRGQEVGTGVVQTELTSPDLPGTTIVRSNVLIT